MTVLYPAREWLHPNEFADYLEFTLPAGFKGMIAMLRNWTFTSFYVMAELWSNIILFVLFWGFANQVTRLGEAKRFYGLFGIGANISGVAAGQVSVYFSLKAFDPNFFYGQTAWEQSMFFILSLMLVAGIAAIALFRWFNTSVLTDPRFYDEEDSAAKLKENRPKGSLKDNIRYLVTSPYLISIAVIVISYNVVINLVEVLWKHQLRELYPNPSDFNLYINQVTTIIGVVATLTALFVSGNSIRKFGWTFTAMLTPVILIITSIGFFFFLLTKDQLAGVVYSLSGMTPLAIVVFFGSAQNVLSRGAKYTVFDATKEMAFVPLAPDTKLKGKAVIDGVCSRLGKSGGSVVHQSLLLAFSSFAASAPYVALFLFITIALWMVAVVVLGRKFNALTVPTPVIPAEPVFVQELTEQKAI